MRHAVDQPSRSAARRCAYVAELRISSDPRLYAELHWRVSWVLITLVLGMLAVPLARLRPRQVAPRVVIAVLLFAVYAGCSVPAAPCSNAATRRGHWDCGGCIPQRWRWAGVTPLPRASDWLVRRRVR